jgi:hypothetical protein
LRLADQRFDGFIRRVSKDAPANSKTILIDIEETWTHDVSDVIANYLPASHWVRNDEIRSVVPDYTEDLNAMHDAEKVLNQKQKEDYFFIIFNFYGNWPKAIQATAAQRARAFLRVIEKWEGE